MTFDPMRAMSDQLRNDQQFMFGRRFKWTSAFCSILAAMREARDEGRKFCPIFF